MNWDALIRDHVKPLVPYAPGLRASEVRDRSGCDHIIKLSSNENPYGPVPGAIAAMQSVLPHLNRYPDGASRALRRQLAGHLKVEERFIAIGNGSNELLRILAEAVLGPGDEAVFAWPSFVVYPMVTQLMGAGQVRVPLADGDVTDCDALLAAITERTKILFLCNPNNPTGTIIRREQLSRLLDRMPEHVLTVVDEAYFEYVTDPEYGSALELFDGERPIAILRTFSKIYSLAGLRCGYGIMPEQLIEAVNKTRDPFNINMVAQIAAYHSLPEQAEVSRRSRENATERRRLTDALTDLGISWAESHTNFVWMHVAHADAVFESLLAQGVIVRNFGGGALRIGIGSPEENGLAIAALQTALGAGA
jgi:histidinol-phosphate aminotransferase